MGWWKGVDGRICAQGMRWSWHIPYLFATPPLLLPMRLYSGVATHNTNTADSAQSSGAHARRALDDDDR